MLALFTDGHSMTGSILLKNFLEKVRLLLALVKITGKSCYLLQDL
jgi:hypothetical protein